MNKLSYLATAFGAATMLAAVPAYAEAPNGPRAEAIVGWDDFNGQPELNDNGVTYGAGVGYDYALSPASSIGLDLEATDSDVNDRTAIAPGVDLKANVKRDLYVGGRYTYAASDKVNLFATVGYTNQRIGLRSTLGQGGNENLDGIRLGAGVQYNLTDNVYLTGSYRYSNYEQGLDRSQIMTGIGYRF